MPFSCCLFIKLFTFSSYTSSSLKVDRSLFVQNCANVNQITLILICVQATALNHLELHMQCMILVPELDIFANNMLEASQFT